MQQASEATNLPSLVDRETGLPTALRVEVFSNRPDWTVDSTIFEMWLELAGQSRSTPGKAAEEGPQTPTTTPQSSAHKP